MGSQVKYDTLQLALTLGTIYFLSSHSKEGLNSPN